MACIFVASRRHRRAGLRWRRRPVHPPLRRLGPLCARAAHVDGPAGKQGHRRHLRPCRLLKHWNRRNGKPLCSWHIKALAPGCLTERSTQLTGLLRWFRYAIAKLSHGETPDPAGVAKEPIKTNVPRTAAVEKIRKDLERLERAISLQADGYLTLAHDELAKLFNDEQMLARPDQNAVRAEEATRLTKQKIADSKALGVPALLTGIGVGANHPRSNSRSWGTVRG